MGTPDFARIQLEALVEAGAEIIGVLTQPDKPQGRRRLMTPSPVKRYALEREIPVYQPKTLKSEEFRELLETLAPELIIVAAYGKLLPEYVINYPALGCVNVHGSLLPEYRGAAPIQRAIMDGKKETGITIMHMDIGLDTGDMISKAVVPIYPDDDFGKLHDRMAAAGAKLLVETLPSIEDGTAPREKQDDIKSTYAAKITNADCSLDFSADANAVYDRIRALSPFPLAFAAHGGKMLKIASAELAETIKEHKNPGEVLKCDAKHNFIEVACGTGSVYLTGVLPEGKGLMRASDLINGRKIAQGDRLTRYELD